MDSLKKQEIALTTLIWVAVFAAVPVLFGYYYVSGRDHAFEFREVTGTWLTMLPFLILFLSHHFAAFRLLEKRRFALYFLSVALLLAVFGFFCFNFGPPRHEAPMFDPGMMGSRPPIDAPMEPGRPIKPEMLLFLIGILVILADIGLKSFFQSIRTRRRLEAMRAENLARQLEALRYQINPHFFMNTLNNIHALVDVDPEAAKTGIEEFSKLMRIVLYDGNAPVIPLSKELDFLRHYVSLMKMRYPESVDIRLAAPESGGTAMVPPLVMASFAENAFKHGISYESDSYVHIEVMMENDKIIFRCDNSRHPSQENARHGLGLENVRKRLDLQYEGNYTLKIEESERAYEILLIIPSSC